MDEVSAGRPTYAKLKLDTTQPSGFLYFVPKLEAWVISQEIGNEEHIMAFANSKVKSPLEVQRHVSWRVWPGQNNRKDGGYGIPVEDYTFKLSVASDEDLKEQTELRLKPARPHSTHGSEPQPEKVKPVPLPYPEEVCPDLSLYAAGWPADEGLDIINGAWRLIGTFPNSKGQPLAVWQKANIDGDIKKDSSEPSMYLVKVTHPAVRWEIHRTDSDGQTSAGKSLVAKTVSSGSKSESENATSTGMIVSASSLAPKRENVDEKNHPDIQIQQSRCWRNTRWRPSLTVPISCVKVGSSRNWSRRE